MKKLIYSLIFLAGFAVLAFANDPVELDFKLTGTVMSLNNKIRSAAIVNDKIWWENQQYLIKDGELKFPLSRSGPKQVTSEEKRTLNSLYPAEDIIILTHVENGKVYFLYRKIEYVLDDKGFRVNKPTYSLPVEPVPSDPF